ncbi:MAG: SMC family ATPase, partial [Bacteroidia bacterium]|nr:SMC family ATPase [Bacteroidia bacterium]
MIIDRLILKNFKRFQDDEICFKDGITGILGNNGTGKSSLVQAIFFALYGVRSTGINSEYVVSSFAGEQGKCDVRLDFEIGGEKYNVIRHYSKKGKHTADIFMGSRQLATGVEAVEKEVVRIIGMGPSDFKNTIYAAQKDLLSLLDSSKEVRKKWFQRALGIDYLNIESQEILKGRIEEKNAELQHKEGELAAFSSRQNEEEFIILKKSVTEFQNTLGSLKKKENNLIEKKNTLNEEFRLFQDLKTKYTELTVKHSALLKEQEGLKKQLNLVRSSLSNLAQLDHGYSTLRQSLSSYPEKKHLLEELRKLKAEYDQINVDIRSAERECFEIKKRTELSKAKVALLDQDAMKRITLIADVRRILAIRPEIKDDSLEQHIASLNEKNSHEIGTISAQLKSFVSEKKKLLSDWDTIQKAGVEGICPLCRQKLGSHYPEIKEEFTLQIQRIDKEILELNEKQKQVTSIKNTINSQMPVISEVRTFTEKLKIRVSIETELKEQLSLLQTNEAACNSLTQKIKDLEFKEEAYDKAGREIVDLEKMQQRFNDLRTELAKVEIFKKQVIDLEAHINQKQSEIEQVFSKIEKSLFDPKKGETLELSRKEIEISLQNIHTEIAQITERLLNTSNKIEEYKRNETLIKDMQMLTEDLKDEINLLKLTRGVIADFVVYLMQMVKGRIQEEVSRIISEITGGRYEQVLLDEDFNLLIRDIDNDYPIDRFSGGEQDDIAVALRIALSRYLAELHQVHESTFLIFDEIFGSQDEERRSNLLTALRTQESRFPQILLISHIAEMQG